MNKGKRIGITILSLIGLALSIELCIVFYKANFLKKYRKFYNDTL